MLDRGSEILSFLEERATDLNNGTATAGTDYTAIPTTTLTFNPGETSKTIR